jgi:hypothetical protein
VTAYRNFKHGGKAYFGMFGIPQREIEDLVKSRGGEIIEVRRVPFTTRWVSCRFCVRKK